MRSTDTNLKLVQIKLVDFSRASFVAIMMNLSDAAALTLNDNTTWNAPHGSFGSDAVARGLTLHPHWRLYRHVILSAPDWFVYGLGVYITAVSILGVVGGGIVIFLFVRFEHRLLSTRL
jgi:hypothetical protein